MQIMKRGPLKYLLLAFLLLIVGFFFILPDNVSLSPQEFDLTEIEPENLLSFYLRFTAEISKGLGIQPLLSPSESQMENLPESFSNSPACGEVVCESFKAEVIIEDFWDEFDLLKEEDRERWVEIFNRPDVQEAITNTLGKANEFIESVECPEGCPNKDFGIWFDLNIIPLDEEGGECRGETNLDFTTQSNVFTGLYGENSCAVATAFALQKAHKKMNEIAKQTCGENCGFTINDLSVIHLGCEVNGLLNDWVRAKIKFEDKLKCSGQSSTEDIN